MTDRFLPGAGKRLKTGLFQGLRASFLTGLVVLAPVVLTIYFTWTFIDFVDSRVVPLIPAAYNPENWLGLSLPGLGVIVALIITTIVGSLARNFLGRLIIRLGEVTVEQVPVVRWLYNAIKQIFETVVNQSGTSFRQTCLVEYPRKGLWGIGFVATTAKGELAERLEGEHVLVFLPTTPNPTSGFLLVVPRSDVKFLDMTVEQAAKLIISAGLVTPDMLQKLETETTQ